MCGLGTARYPPMHFATGPTAMTERLYFTRQMSKYELEKFTRTSLVGFRNSAGVSWREMID